MKNDTDNWIGIIIGALGILAIISIFEDDNSKIISKRGKKLLSDTKKMQDINEKILKSESQDKYNEILI